GPPWATVGATRVRTERPVRPLGNEDMTNRSRRKRLVLAATGLVALALIVAGCGPSNGQNSLQPKGTQAHQIDNLFWPVLGVAVVVFLLVAFGVVYAAIRFRSRPGNERPRQVHGHTALQIAWTHLP